MTAVAWDARTAARPPAHAGSHSAGIGDNNRNDVGLERFPFRRKRRCRA